MTAGEQRKDRETISLRPEIREGWERRECVLSTFMSVSLLHPPCGSAQPPSGFTGGPWKPQGPGSFKHMFMSTLVPALMQVSLGNTRTWSPWVFVHCANKAFICDYFRDTWSSSHLFLKTTKKANLSLLSDTGKNKNIQSIAGKHPEKPRDSFCQILIKPKTITEGTKRKGPLRIDIWLN